MRPKLTIVIAVEPGVKFKFAGDPTSIDVLALIDNWYALVKQYGALTQDKIDKLAERMHTANEKLKTTVEGDTPS